MLTRHGSVEVFDAGYKMVLPNKQNKNSSQTQLEEIQADHYFFPGITEKFQGKQTNVIKNQLISILLIGKETYETVEAKVKPSVECIGVQVNHPGIRFEIIPCVIKIL